MDTESKKISIVMPVYNGERYLSEAIDSIIQQTYSNWELIVINDCSTDATEQIVEDYIRRDARIRLYTNPENLKLPKSLNVGFEKATGEYYTWTSDDNIMLPNMLSTLLRTLEKNPQAGMAYSNFINIDANGEQLGTVELGEPQRLPFGNTCGASFLYRRGMANQIGEYDTNLFLAEDYDYWIRMYHLTTIIHINDYLYLYRQHNNSLSQKRKEEISNQVYRVIKKNFLVLLFKMTSNKERNTFLDILINIAEEQDRYDLIRMLCKMMPAYNRHYKKMKLLKKVNCLLRH